MKNLHLSIITPERTLIDETVIEVSLPTKTGQISILPNHAPLVTEIAPGEIIVHGEKDKKIALVYGGFALVKEKSEIVVLANSADHLDELDEKEIMEARKRAEDAKAAAIGDKERFAEAEAELARIATQLKALGKHSNRLRTKRHTDFKNI